MRGAGKDAGPPERIVAIVLGFKRRLCVMIGRDAAEWA
jgi:hypothetical protein